MSVASLLLVTLLCLLVEALFTGSEMVLVTADRHRLKERAKDGECGAALALRLLEHPDRAIATTLTATNLVVVFNTVYSTAWFLGRFGSHAEVYAVAFVTPLVILFGEIVPKSFARSRADLLAGPAARIVSAAQTVLYPVVQAVSALAQAIAKPFGGVPPLHGMVTREELRLLLQMSHQAGSDVEPHERTMVRRVFNFGETKVMDVFRPYAQTAVLPEDATVADSARLGAERGHSRYPVWRDRTDHVVGYLHVLDTVGLPPDAPIRPLLRKALFVPDLMPIDELLRKFQEARTVFAVVVDEYGGVNGIVTMEDLVEEVVGEIEDEYDRGTIPYRRLSESVFVVPGRMDLSRLSEETSLRFPEGEYSSVAGLVVSLAGRVPSMGESFGVPGAMLEVTASSDRAVLEVKVTKEERKDDDA